ncbi:unnamed protein product, partial [Rotaria sp. Silwood2]
MDKMKMSIATTNTAATPSEPMSIRPQRLLPTRIVQNYILVWLDANIDDINSSDCTNIINKLSEVVNRTRHFTDVDECIDFITDIHEEKVFMIFPDSYKQTILPIIRDIPQINSIFIWSNSQAGHENWIKHLPKTKGIFTDIALIFKALQQVAHECDQNMISISFVSIGSESSKQNLNELDSSFMYTQIMKEILLTIDFQQKHFDEFIAYCGQLFSQDQNQLQNLEKLEREYHKHDPIWWYTYPCFLYSMLNHSLRIMDIDLIIKLGFFIRGLHNHIVGLHAKQFLGHSSSTSFTVYRGQGLSEDDFDRMMNTPGGLLSFNNFLSTSMDRQVSLAFAESNQTDLDLIGVLFAMTIDSLISDTAFAKVGHDSHFEEEEEILFSMNSIFRIGSIKQIDGNIRLWQVQLTLTSDKDPDLHILTDHIRKETHPAQKGWDRL